MNISDTSSGYGCANINGQTCTIVATSTTVPTVTCDGSKSGDFGFQTIPDAKASITAFSLLAPMIQINWQSSDRPESTTSSGPTATETSDRTTRSGTETSDTSGPETLVLDGNPQTTGGGTVDIGADAPTSTPTLQENETSSDSGPLSSGAKVAIGVTASAAVLVMLVCALFYVWRRRKTQREEQELDRLYGLKHTMSSGGDFTSGDDIPGWYRGQRLVTPTKDPFGGHDASQGHGMVPEMERPAAPYYRPYRPA
jgi:hypothetical protein